MKAQIFSIDVMIAVPIFFFSLAIVTYLWLVVPQDTQDLQYRANLLADRLVFLEIATENMVDCGKLQTTASKDYETLKSDLNLRYNYYVYFSNTTPICNGYANFGVNLQSADHASSVVRIVHVSPSSMQMVVTLYD